MPERSPQPARIGHYRVLAPLGTGVLTNVYRAEAEGIARPVVVKVLRSTTGPDSLFFRRFKREARLLAALHHPNVVTLFDFDLGVAGDRPPYMVLEYVDGASLADVLKRGKRLEPDEAAAIALEIARGLAYAHKRDVVHRDVKPGNVLLGKVASASAADLGRDEPIAVKIVDFGIATEGREPSLAEPRDEEAAGTPAYMSPEQLLGEVVDARADQFALGVVFYQMLAGVRPFDGDDGRPAIQRIRRDPPRPFKSVGVTVPRALERCVLRLLAKRPADRYESTDEIVDELLAYFEGRAIDANDLGTFHRRVLARSGVFDERRALREEAPPTSARPTRASAPRPRAIPFAPTLIGVALACVALIAGGGVIQWRSGGIKSGTGAPTKPPPGSDVGVGPVGYVRVLVKPWADVVVDGEKVDTTPFARAIKLRPGRHVFELVHPSVKERRLVDVVADQTTLLDVTLDVKQSFSPPDEFALPESSASIASSASAPPKTTPFGVPSTLQEAP